MSLIYDEDQPLFSLGLVAVITLVLCILLMHECSSCTSACAKQGKGAYLQVHAEGGDMCYCRDPNGRLTPQDMWNE